MLLIGIIYWRIPKYIKTFDFKLNKEYGMKTDALYKEWPSM